MKFIYQSCPVRILFGDHLIDALKQELPADEITRFWIIASSRYGKLVDEISGLNSVDVIEHFSRVIQHVPEDQVQKARHSVAKTKPDIILSIGGGSAAGLAKAVALKHPVPIWAVPTTYSGSEMTNIYGITSHSEKIVGRDPNAQPDRVFYDSELSLTLPFKLASKSAVNALAHLVEASYSTEYNPFTYHRALLGIRKLYPGLRQLAMSKKLTKEINEKLLLGASIAGSSLCEVNMSLHHKSAHVLGGTFGMDHSSVHTALLPYVFNYQWSSLSETVKEHFCEAFSSEDPPKALLDTIRKLEVETTLKAIGFGKEDLKPAAEQISHINFESPAPVTSELIHKLLLEAWEGKLR